MVSVAWQAEEDISAAAHGIDCCRDEAGRTG
jgi:hypothetical protein